jgi:hypothetical protein
MTIIFIKCGDSFFLKHIIGKWAVMYLCARGTVVACERSCICVLGESLFSQATTIPLAHKYMTAHKQQRFP